MFARTSFEDLGSNISFEDLVEIGRADEDISLEFLQMFAARWSDRLRSMFTLSFFDYDDKAIKAALSKRNQVRAKVKLLDFTSTADCMTVQPSGFSGFYTDYLQLLYDLSVTKNLVEQTMTLCGDLELEVSTIMNTSPSLITQISRSAQSESEKAFKNVTEYKKQIGSFFPIDNNKTRTTFREIVRTYADFSDVLTQIESFDRKFDFKKVDQFRERLERLNELVSLFLNRNDQESFKSLQDPRQRKVMFNMIWTTALHAEMISHLYTNLFSFIGVVKVNFDDFISL